MIQIRFISFDNSEQTLLAKTGQSLMKAAVNAGGTGFDADCGGTLTCATCHVMVDEPWNSRLVPAGRDETDMLDFAASRVEPGSRLCCQIVLTPELDGLVVRLPASQY